MFAGAAPGCLERNRNRQLCGRGTEFLGRKMKKFLEYLRRHTVVGLDTALFIYHLEDHPRYSVITADLFRKWKKGVLKE